MTGQKNRARGFPQDPASLKTPVPRDQNPKPKIPSRLGGAVSICQIGCGGRRRSKPRGLGGPPCHLLDVFCALGCSGTKLVPKSPRAMHQARWREGRRQVKLLQLATIFRCATFCFHVRFVCCSSFYKRLFRESRRRKHPPEPQGRRLEQNE